MHKTRILASLACAGVSVLSGAAQADIVTQYYSTTITDIRDVVPSGPSVTTVPVTSIPGNSIAVGDVVSGMFSFDTSLATPNFTSSTFVRYDAPLSLTLDIHTASGLVSMNYAGTAYFSVNDSVGGSSLLDRFQFGIGLNAGLAPSLPGAERTGVEFTFDQLAQSNPGDPLAMPVGFAPTSPGALSDLILSTTHDNNGFTGTGFEYLMYTGPLALSNEPSPVPLPAGIYLLGSGLFGLAGALRRKRNA